jgi:Tfp pilus assembly protein PilF
MAASTRTKLFASRPRVERAAFVLFVLVLLPCAVSAQPANRSEDQAAARALFEQARTLVKAGDYAAACPKFEAASRLYVSPGTLLNLGDCHEQLGQTASAWTRFGEAASVATRMGRDETAEEARRRQRAVEPRLMHVSIRVSTPVEGLAVERDGIAIAEAAWGSSLPVDAGKHRLTASAPKHEPWSTSFELSRAGETVMVDVPALKALAEPSRTEGTELGAAGDGASPSSDAAPPASDTVQWVLIGGGAAVAVGGTALMLVQSNRASRARADNDPDLWDSAQTSWSIGLIGAIVGGAAAGAGAIWMLAGTPDESQAFGATPWVAADAAGLNVRGTW